ARRRPDRAAEGGRAIFEDVGGCPRQRAGGPDPLGPGAGPSEPADANPDRAVEPLLQEEGGSTARAKAGGRGSVETGGASRRPSGGRESADNRCFRQRFGGCARTRRSAR